MPTFKLGSLIPGIKGPDTISINDTSVDVEFADEMIRTQDGQPITLSCGFQTLPGNKYKLSLSASADPLCSFAEGKLHLTSIELSVRFKPSGNPDEWAPDTDVSDLITVQGSAEWRDMPQALELAGNKLPLIVGYRYEAAGNSRFTLELANAVEIGPVFTRLNSAEVEFGVLPEQRAFEITLQGEADITSAGKNKINEIVQPVFNKTVQQILSLPASFFYHQKFRLEDRSFADTPVLMLLPNWKSGAPPALPGIPDGIALTIGRPQLAMKLPGFDTAPGCFDVRLSDCSIQFPELEGLESLSIGGAFQLVTESPGTTKFTFTPNISGGIDLPEVLQLLFSRLEWLAELSPIDEILEKLQDALRMSATEYEWFIMLQGLLPSPGESIADLNAFVTQLKSLLNAAASAIGEAERVFLIAFRALQPAEWRNVIFPKLWGIWMEDAGRGLPKLPDLLWLLRNLPADVYRDALRHLLGLSGLDITRMFTKILEFGTIRIETAYSEFIPMLSRLLSESIEVLQPQSLGETLFAIWESGPDSLKVKIPLFRQPFEYLGPDFGLPDIKLPISIMMIAQAVVHLAFSVCANLVKPLEGFPQTVAFLNHLARPITEFFDMLDHEFCTSEVKILAFFEALIGLIEGRTVRESLILESCRYPIFGILMLIAAIIRTSRKPMLGLKLFTKNIEEMPGLKVRRLDAPWEYPNEPEKAVKYLILSDVHRDDHDDDAGLFRFGGIDHFKDNKELYLEILEYADENHYTVIEVGDCEELWFIRDFDDFEGYPQKMGSIIDNNRPVYDKLKELHTKGRYFRIQGNHDSYLREPQVLAKLKDAISSDFEIYDFIIIPGVKSMGHDFDVGDDFDDLNLAQQIGRVTQAIVRILTPELGFDSRPWEGRSQLIIAHGHQWDFWNCDEHSIVGKLFSNIFGVPADKLMDPFVDMEGIAWLGAPMYNFQSALAGLPVLSNWPAYRPAMKYAHGIQHMDDSDRLLTDDYFFWESFVALCAMFGMPLDAWTLKRDANDDPVMEGGKPKFVKEPLASAEPGLISFFKHRNNLVCIGHTHIPHSRPYFDVARYLAGTAVAEIIGSLPDILPINLRTFNLQSGYLNCGTSGWMTGVVWAIDIHESGQPRLAYWTRRHREPEFMDWELYPWEPQKRGAFEQVKAELFGEIEEYLEKAGDLFGAAAGEVLDKIQNGLPLPVQAVAALALKAGEIEPLDLERLDLPEITDRAERIRDQIRQLQSYMLKILAVSQKRQLSGPFGSPVKFSINVPLFGEIRERLEMLKGIFGQLADVSDFNAVRLACTWLCTLKNLASLATRTNRGASPGFAPDDPTAVLWNVIMMTQMLPAPVDPESGEWHVSAALKIETGKLTFEITIQ